MAAPQLGQLTTVTFGTNAFTGEYMSVEVDTFKRGEIKTSHLGTTGWDTFLPTTLKDAGTITLKLQFDSTEAAANYDNFGAAETITINWSGTSSWAFSGFCTGIQVSAEIDTLLEATFTFKCTSSVTIA